MFDCFEKDIESTSILSSRFETRSANKSRSEVWTAENYLLMSGVQKR